MTEIHPLIGRLEQDAMTRLDLKPPSFRPGDTVRVGVRVVEGETERTQLFEGVCIARHNRGLSSTFTVRKISYGEGVERVFPLYSPRIASIELVKSGRVRRAKLYYLRSRRGKSARIAERTAGVGKTAKTGKGAKVAAAGKDAKAVAAQKTDTLPPNAEKTDKANDERTS